MTGVAIPGVEVEIESEVEALLHLKGLPRPIVLNSSHTLRDPVAMLFRHVASGALWKSVFSLLDPCNVWRRCR